jgi:hypothetical protein
MGDLCRLGAAESKYGQETTPSLTAFERGAFELKNHILLKYILGNADLVENIAACVVVECFRQQGFAALVSLRRACAGSITAM